MESYGSGFNDILIFVMMCEYVVWVARSDRIEAARYMKMLRYYSVSCFLKSTSSLTMQPLQTFFVSLMIGMMDLSLLAFFVYYRNG